MDQKSGTGPPAPTLWRASPAPMVSVIVPLAEGEAEPLALLEGLPPDFEIILARGGTRATGMNRAGEIATGRHLWFLHADTSLSPQAIAALRARLPCGEAILYFDLRFDGGLPMRLTEIGVHLRSRMLGLPFGDQALCLSRENFARLGGYDERLVHGEDHRLIRKARRAGLAIAPVGARLQTSARKYQRHGWLRTTWRHLRLTIRQMREPF